MSTKKLLKTKSSGSKSKKSYSLKKNKSKNKFKEIQPKESRKQIYKSKNFPTKNLIFQNIYKNNKDCNYAFGQYDDFVVIIDKRNGFINATKLCIQAGKNFDTWFDDKSNKDLVKNINIGDEEVIIQNKKGPYEICGYYIHPNIVPYLFVLV
uniref:KilA-n domain-containing protein n=1 Tax=Borely moumouvirus TaxID=2712067 RepID=A0A6G6ADL3_9VIRU